MNTPGAKAAETYRMRESKISKFTEVGCRIVFVVAVVIEGVFKTFFGCVPADLDLKVVPHMLGSTQAVEWDPHTVCRAMA